MKVKEGYSRVSSQGVKKIATDHLFTFFNICIWILFISNICLLFLNFDNTHWNDFDIIRINKFTILIWTMVSFFAAIVFSYSARYLHGFKHRAYFIFLTLGFTLSVMLFVASEHVILMLLSWFAMGYFMARLIGSDKERRGKLQNSHKNISYYPVCF
jgi:NADH:ubiquinone oxidoreductase subunit 5 (subunit L)/multisubunit Na+/H+ antiporter MnhA subunit